MALLEAPRPPPATASPASLGALRSPPPRGGRGDERGNPGMRRAHVRCPRLRSSDGSWGKQRGWGLLLLLLSFLGPWGLRVLLPGGIQRHPVPCAPSPSAARAGRGAPGQGGARGPPLHGAPAPRGESGGGGGFKGGESPAGRGWRWPRREEGGMGQEEGRAEVGSAWGSPSAPAPTLGEGGRPWGRRVFVTVPSSGASPTSAGPHPLLQRWGALGNPPSPSHPAGGGRGPPPGTVCWAREVLNTR